jgi:hypothetical protein
MNRSVLAFLVIVPDFDVIHRHGKPIEYASPYRGEHHVAEIRAAWRKQYFEIEPGLRSGPPEPAFPDMLGFIPTAAPDRPG